MNDETAGNDVCLKRRSDVMLVVRRLCIGLPECLIPASAIPTLVESEGRARKTILALSSTAFCTLVS